MAFYHSSERQSFAKFTAAVCALRSAIIVNSHWQYPVDAIAGYGEPGMPSGELSCVGPVTRNTGKGSRESAARGLFFENSALDAVSSHNENEVKEDYSCATCQDTGWTEIL
jgi:hypothetical protein